jgi:four helix bundle protein
MSTSFEDLDVWKKACRLSVKLFKLLKDCHDYGLKNQMLRSAVSIPSNIAEGSERGTVPDFQRFINIAKGSAAELRTQVYIASEVGIFAASEKNELISELKSISKMLQALHGSLKK